MPDELPEIDYDPSVFASLEAAYSNGRLCVSLLALDYPDALLALERFVATHPVDALAFHQATIPVPSLAALLASEHLRALRTLVLDESTTGLDPVTDAFAGVGHTSLRALHLLALRRDDLPSVADLLRLPALAALETLELNWTYKDVAPDLFAVDSMPRQLVLEGLDGSQLEALIAAPYFAHLERLDLGESELRPVDVFKLLSAVGRTRLRQLVVGHRDGWSATGDAYELEDDRAELRLMAGDFVVPGVEMVESERSSWGVWPPRTDKPHGWRDGAWA